MSSFNLDNKKKHRNPHESLAKCTPKHPLQFNSRRLQTSANNGKCVDLASEGGMHQGILSITSMPAATSLASAARDPSSLKRTSSCCSSNEETLSPRLLDVVCFSFLRVFFVWGGGGGGAGKWQYRPRDAATMQQCSIEHATNAKFGSCQRRLCKSSQPKP